MMIGCLHLFVPLTIIIFYSCHDGSSLGVGLRYVHPTFDGLVEHVGVSKCHAREFWLSPQ